MVEYMKQFFKRFMFSRSFLKEVLVLAIPFMLQNLIITGVNLIDNLMVGSLGDAALGGVSAVNKYYLVADFSGFGIASATSVFMSQYLGAGDKEKLKMSYRIMLVALTGLGFGFFIVSRLFPYHILRYFTNNQETIQLGTDYLSVVCITLILTGILRAIYSAIRVMGNTKILLVTSSISMAVNMVLNYLLIFGHFNFPKMGIKGAALATVIARVVEVIISLVIVVWKKYEFNTRIVDLFKIDLAVLKVVLTKALPLFVNEILWSTGMATIFKLYSTRGVEVMAGYAAAFTISDMFFVLFGGMSMVTTIFVARSLGANKIEEAKEKACQLFGIGVFLAILFGIGLFSASFALPHLYKHLSLASQGVAVNVLRIQAFMFWIYMFSAESYYVLTAGGDSKNTLIIDGIFMWGVNILALSLAAYFTDWTYLGVFIVGQSTDLLKMFCAFGMVLKEKWANNLTLLTKNVE